MEIKINNPLGRDIIENLAKWKNITILSQSPEEESVGFKDIPGKFGYGKGMVVMHPDFDEPLEEFAEYCDE